MDHTEPIFGVAPSKSSNFFLQPEHFSARFSCYRTLGLDGAAALIMRRAVKATFCRAAGALAKAMALVASGVIRIMVVRLF